jgi:acyl dehydratase
MNDDQSVDGATAWTIRPEDLEADQKALGVDTADPSQEFLGTVTPDAIRNFAHSYGDDNPLFCDPAYGATTRWGGQIAPSLMAEVVNAPLRGDPPDPGLRGGRYKGIHVFASAFAWECYRPIRPGDVVHSFRRLDSVEERDTSFAGRAVFRTLRVVKMNQDADVLGVHRMTGIYTERKTAKDRGANAEIPLASYSDDDIAAIDALYAAEQRRGAEPRWFEDATVGEALPPMVKGPFTLTDVIRFHAGGYFLTDLRTSRLAWQNRQKKPAFYVKNSQGIPDVAQRGHWDPDWARAIGNPAPVDYGAMREFWLHHYLTDWIGDDGWVRSQRVELRKFSYLGDTQYLSGEVTAARRDGDECLVDVTLRCVNQRDVTTALAEATVSLPSRENGPVVLPVPADDLRRQAARLMARHGELLREGPP